MSRLTKTISKPVCLLFGHDWEHLGSRRKCRYCGKRQKRNVKWHEWEDA